MFFSRNKQSRVNKNRLLVLFGLIVLVLSLYVGRLINLQVENKTVYQNLAEQISSRSIRLPAQRGKIYDRNYDQPLATNVESYSLLLTPAQVPEGELESLLRDLADFLGIEYRFLSAGLAPSSYQRYRAVEIYSGLEYEEVARLSENIDRFPGVSWSKESLREYSLGASFAHVIGYVGDITAEDLQVLYNEGYNQNSIMGQTGIEKEYDQYLRGTDGRSYLTVDVRGRGIEEAEDTETAPQHGNDLVLTIDRRIQVLSEKALGDRVGSVVVLKPATGEILAMVSKPSYDPNLFYSEDAGRAFATLSQDTNYPFLNRTIQVVYPPASVFKTVMTSAIVEEKLFPFESEIMCEGTVFYGDRYFDCHRKSGHGLLDLLGAFKESCDIYYYTVGRDYVGIDRISEYAGYYGLGSPTQIDLPGEMDGNVPTRLWKEQTYNTPWTGGDTMNTSIGQGFLLVTPMQIANLMAGIVNNGTIYKPHLLREVRDQASGEVLEVVESEVLSSIPLKRETFEFVQGALREVCVSGTARFLISTDVVEVAGKTGTGEIGVEDQYHSWFASYAPYQTDQPEERVVVVVLVDASDDYEGWAPVASNMIIHGIFAQRTYEETVADLRLWYLTEPRE